MTRIVFRSKRGDHLERRQQILEAATASFSMFGYKATTVEQVAKIAQVGKGTVYTFFENKEQLLQEAVLAMIEEMKAETENNFNPSMSFMENVHDLMMHLLKYRERHLLFMKLVEEEKRLQTPTVKTMIVNINRAIVDYVSDKLKTAITREEIRPCNTELIAYVMLKTYVALIIDWEQVHGEPLSEQEIVEVIQSTIIGGLSQ